MSDKEKAIKKITDFLQDKTKRILLVRGYDCDAKVRVVLACLNNEFDKGIIRTSSMSDVSFLVNRSFNKEILPRIVKSTTNYEIGRMLVNINSYVTHTKSNPKGNADTFTLFFPVQTVLGNDKRYDDFLRQLKSTESGKVILITTTEWAIEELDIENHVDEVFFYSVEQDNPEMMSNLRYNGAFQ